MLIFAWSTWMLGALDVQAGYWDVFWPRLIQGFGLGFLFVPLTTISLSDVPIHELAGATGVYTLLRQLGGSFGIAILTTMLTHQTAVAWNVLSSEVTSTHGYSIGTLTQLVGTAVVDDRLRLPLPSLRDRLRAHDAARVSDSAAKAAGARTGARCRIAPSRRALLSFLPRERCDAQRLRDTGDRREGRRLFSFIALDESGIFVRLEEDAAFHESVERRTRESGRKRPRRRLRAARIDFNVVPAIISDVERILALEREPDRTVEPDEPEVLRRRRTGRNFVDAIFGVRRHIDVVLVIDRDAARVGVRRRRFRTGSICPA